MKSSSPSRRSGQANPMADAKELPRKPKTTLSSCFAPFRLKPVRTRVPPRRDERQRAPLGEQRESQEDQGGVFRSAASRIYANLKKVKRQAVSPGGRLVSFVNSIFSTTPKSAKKSDPAEANLESKLKSGQTSSFTSAFSTVSSLSRPCLSKRSPSTREQFRSEAKRTVHFYPVVIIVDEDCRPCGYKCLEGGEKQSSLKGQCKKEVEEEEDDDDDGGASCCSNSDLFELDLAAINNKYYAELPVYKKKGFESKGQCKKEVEEEEDDDNDGGTSSCSSSDLFELDLAAINNKYYAELPVYKTTYVD